MIIKERAVLAALASIVLLSGSTFAVAQGRAGENGADVEFLDPRQAPGLEEQASREAAEQAAAEERRHLAEEAEALRKKVEETEAKAAAERSRLAAESEALRREAEIARKKTEEERREREEALAAAEAEAKRHAEEEAATKKAAEEEEARKRAEAEARRRAEEEAAAKKAAEEEEARKRAEAEVRRRAEEDAAAKKAAEEEEARKRAEAEVRRRAEEDAAAKKAAEEEEARKRAEAKARQQAEEAAQKAEEIAAEKAAKQASTCNPIEPPIVSTSTEPGGILNFEIDAPCYAQKSLSIKYGPYAFPRHIDERGRASFKLDLFLGANVGISLDFEDGSSSRVELPPTDFSQLSKLAIAWKSPVNLDLHALEYLAAFSSSGHIWAGSASSYDNAVAKSAQNKGHGFLSTQAGDGEEGDKVEVYTFVRVKNQRSGVVTTFVDYATRGEMPTGENCGDGRLAAIPFDVIELSSQGTFRIEKRQLGTVPCNQALAQTNRYNPDTINDLQIRR